MIPHQEHAFYMWLAIVAIVCIAALVGALIDRYRIMHANRVLLENSRRRACSQQPPHHLE